MPDPVGVQYEVLVKTLNGGVPIEPFRGKSLPPIGNCIGRREKLIQRAQEKYASRCAVIEDKLNRWITI